MSSPVEHGLKSSRIKTGDTTCATGDESRGNSNGYCGSSRAFIITRPFIFTYDIDASAHIPVVHYAAAIHMCIGPDCNESSSRTKICMHEIRGKMQSGLAHHTCSKSDIIPVARSLQEVDYIDW